jgi:ribonuclease HII
VIEPDTSLERELWLSGKLRIAGVDEVGLGPLAGPVLAAACILPVNCHLVKGVRDSKTLSPSQRERLAAGVWRQAISVGVGAASVAEIEEMNVLAASRLAMSRALLKVGAYDHVLVDGRPIPGWDRGSYTAIVDGDALVYSIACASIVAKVIRDRLMAKLATAYPGYGWEHNAGYSTREHMQALRVLGPTRLHRRCFAPVRDL